MVELNIYLPRAMEITILLFWLFLISFFLRLAFLVIQAQQKTQSRYQTTRNKSVRKSDRQQQYQFGIPKTGKWQKLLNLVQGDVATAKRLIEFEQRRNPTRSIDWCVEKALWQLERDRRF